MAGQKYQGMTFEEMDALVKKNKGLTEQEKAMLGQLTKQDYDDYAREVNWATSTPTYTGWNGGSVTGDDMMQATYDSIQHGYDVWLDPRNGTREMINNLLQDVNIKANEDAVNGIGNYDTNRQNYLNQIGWTNYQDVFKRLQDTGSLGLTDLEGNDLTAMALAERDKMLPGTPYELSAEQLAQMQADEEYRNYVAGMLSPMMQGGSQKTAGGPWSYNKETDPVWQAYLNQYTRGGEKAMNDAMAQLSARTGGMASTYAGQVAQQTMNDYMKGATDVIPQLAEQDYDRWLTDKQMAIDAEQRQYERQMAAEQQQYERQMALRALAADQQAQNANLLLSLMESYGYMPSAEELAAAGLTQGMADAIGTAYQNNLALQWAKTNKSGGSGGGGGTVDVNPTIGPDIYQQMLQMGLGEGEAYAFLRSTYGMDDDDAAAYLDYYREYLDNQGGVEDDAGIDVNAILGQVYPGLGGMTLGDYTDNAGAFQNVTKRISEMKKFGQTNADIMAYIEYVYQNGAMNPNDYALLKAQYS